MITRELYGTVCSLLASIFWHMYKYKKGIQSKFSFKVLALSILESNMIRIGMTLGKVFELFQIFFFSAGQMLSVG